MKILFVGDIVGSPGRRIFKLVAKRMRAEQAVHAIVANAENAAILAFGDCAFPSTCFGRKKCDLNNDLWHNRSTHMECLTFEFTGLRGFSRRPVE